MRPCFSLRPSAKDQGITRVLGVVLVVVVLYLVHFLYKRNLSEKIPLTGIGNWGSSDPQLSTYPLSYKAIDIIDVKIDLYISPQTLDQYWSTLV